MKYVKLFEEFNTPTKGYHNSPSKIDSVEHNRPMWLALTKEMGLNYLHSAKSNLNWDHSYLYEFDINGIILEKQEIIEALKDHELTYDDFVSELVCNPTQHYLSNMEEIKILQNVSDGIIHHDYDPRNSQAPSIKVMFVFNPSKTLQNMKLVDKF